MSVIAAADSQRLAPWLQPQHLDPDALARLGDRFQGSPDRFVVLDDFLVPERLAAIRHLVLEDGHMEPVYKLYGSNDWVDKATFDAAPQDRRFINERIYRGPRPGRAMARSALMDIGLRKTLGSAPFLAWLGAIVGRAVSRVGMINLKWLDRGHFLRRHSDAVGTRMACMVLYLHEEWRPEYRGRFIMYRNDGGEEIVPPRANRLILFDPNAGTDHAVEPMADEMGDWVRINYTAWFY